MIVTAKPAVKSAQEPIFRQVAPSTKGLSGAKVNQKTIDENLKKLNWESVLSEANLEKLNIVVGTTASVHLESQPRLTGPNNTRYEFITPPLLVSGPCTSGLGRLGKRGADQGPTACHYGAFFKRGATEQALAAEPNLLETQDRFFKALKDAVIAILWKMFDMRTFQPSKRGVLVTKAMRRVQEERKDDPTLTEQQRAMKVSETDEKVIEYAFEGWVNEATVFFNGNEENVEGGEPTKSAYSDENKDTQFYASQKVWMPPRGKKVEELKAKCKGIEKIETEDGQFKAIQQAGFNYNPVCIRDGDTGRPIKDMEEERILNEYILLKRRFEIKGAKDLSVLHAKRDSELAAARDPFKQRLFGGAMATAQICLSPQSMKPPSRTNDTTRFGVKIELHSNITMCQQGLSPNAIPQPMKIFGETPLVAQLPDEEEINMTADEMIIGMSGNFKNTDQPPPPNNNQPPTPPPNNQSQMNSDPQSEKENLQFIVTSAGEPTDNNTQMRSEQVWHRRQDYAPDEQQPPPKMQRMQYNIGKRA